ncbi:hypothetical protein [Slackia isoflavoniconvertens]|uniref:hypothetical protein n=1 Tax=Slackia isoflavoniconvertens TaxID=572010 RepID=UPI003F950D96
MDDLDPIVRQYLGVINRHKERCGMSTTEYARRLGMSDSNAGKKLRGEVSMTASELIETTWLFGIDFTEYFHVAFDSFPERIHPPRKKAR